MARVCSVKLLPWVVSMVTFSVLTTGESDPLQESQAPFASAEPSIAKEGVSGFQLLCQYLSKPGETVFLVTWSRLQKNDVTVIFEKRFPRRNTFENYTFFDSWERREAKHNVMTFADVSLADGEVTRHDAGTYRCEVITDVNRLHRDVNVTVLYGPGKSIHISSQGGSFRIKEGETITLVCNTSCFPSCNFRWTCAGCVATREPTLTISGIQRDQSGVYTCLAYNTVSRGRADVTVDVLFRATVMTLQFAGSQRSPLPVPEGQSVSISCQATGNPPPRDVTWSVRSGQWKDNKTFGMRYGHDQSSVFMLPSTSCHDNDEYSCTTSNGVGEDTDSVILQVLCAPIPDRAPENHHGNSTFVVNFNQTINLTYSVIGRPRPEVEWYRVTSDVDTVVIENSDVDYDDVRATLKTWISVTASMREDYGHYRVRFQNDRGFFVQNFSVVSREPPQPPYNVTVVNITLTSFCVTWTPGFEGGATQRIRMTCFSQSNDADFTNFTEVFTVNNQTDDTTQCVVGLRHSTGYNVVLRAENMYGSSHKTVVTVTTLSEAKTHTQVLLFAPGITVGVPAGVVILLLVVVVSLLICRRRHCCHARKTNICGTKEVPMPLCINNENVRLSYLDVSRQDNYVDAMSRGVDVTDDVTSTRSDVSMTRERIGSRLDVGRPLGVEDLSRRPSSTSSCNIYLDILGDPSTYINQEEDNSSYMNTEADTANPTTDDSHLRLASMVQGYILMTGTGKGETGNISTHSETDDVIPESCANYDDAWNRTHQGGGRSVDHLGSHAAMETRNSRRKVSQPGSEGKGVPDLSGGLTIPTITVSEHDSVRDCAYWVSRVEKADDDFDDDDASVYDVIRDSDVED